MNEERLHWKIEDIFSGMHRRSEQENKDMVKALCLEAIEKAKVLAECLDHVYIQIDHHPNYVWEEEMKKLMEMIERVLNQWEEDK